MNRDLRSDLHDLWRDMLDGDDGQKAEALARYENLLLDEIVALDARLQRLEALVDAPVD